MSKTTKLSVLVGAVALFVTANGLRVGAKGKVQTSQLDVATVIGTLTKSDARKVRKALHGNGLISLALAGTNGHLKVEKNHLDKRAAKLDLLKVA